MTISPSTVSERTTPDVPGAPIRITGVSKKYKDLTVLDHVDLDIHGGEFLTLLGASGSGKSTLLNILAGFVKPTSGSIEVGGVDMSRLPPHKRGLGMVFQHYALFPHMTVAENVAFPLKRLKVPKAEIATRVAEALDMVELGRLSNRKPTEISGGQQQRVALARAIVFRPRVLLMDEPLGALDKMLREQLQLEIRKLHKDMGITFVFVTHDQDEALTMSDRIALLQDGRIVQLGTPEELYDAPNCRYTAEFVGVSNLFHGTVKDSTFIDEGHGREYRLPAGHRPEGTSLLVRPEHLRISPAGAVTNEVHDRIAATVEDCIYLGSSRTVQARTDAGALLTARTEVPRSPDGIHVGARIQMHWEAADARVLA